LTKRLSAEETAQRDDDMRRFLNSYNMSFVALGCWRHRGFPYWNPIAEHARFLNARMPATRYANYPRRWAVGQ
jgi:hypothetical protein